MVRSVGGEVGGSGGNFRGEGEWSEWCVSRDEKRKKRNRRRDSEYKGRIIWESIQEVRERDRQEDF